MPTKVWLVRGNHEDCTMNERLVGKRKTSLCCCCFFFFFCEGENIKRWTCWILMFFFKKFVWVWFPMFCWGKVSEDILLVAFSWPLISFYYSLLWCSLLRVFLVPWVIRMDKKYFSIKSCVLRGSWYCGCFLVDIGLCFGVSLWFGCLFLAPEAYIEAF